MGKVCHFFHACRHGVRQFGRRVGIAPKNADDHQKQNGGGNVFVQSDDRAFVGIDTISHEFGAVKTYGPNNDKNGYISNTELIMKNIINEWLMNPIKKATLFAGGCGF